MNNNMYHWHDERMVDLEMKEIYRELEQASMLKEAGLSGENWLSRLISGLLRAVFTRRQPVQGRGSAEPQVYQSRGGKMAP